DQSINQSKITKNLSQNEVHSDPDLILYNPSVLIDKEPFYLRNFLLQLFTTIKNSPIIPLASPKIPRCWFFLLQKNTDHDE
ncbi:hypothetical protein ACQ7DC_16095, partial [Enterococcus gallinarum]